LGLPLLRVPSGSHSKIFSGSLVSWHSLYMRLYIIVFLNDAHLI
jgi:hypothetical protein